MKTTTVQYTGDKEPYKDFAQGSGLTFMPGQARALPDDLARKLLRQVDIFAPAGLDDVQIFVPVTTEENQDTDKMLLELQAQKEEQDRQDRERNDLLDQIRVMDRSQLDILARDRWNQVLHHKTSLENARAKVMQFVDQYGTA